MNLIVKTGRKGKGKEASNPEAMRPRKQSNSERQFLVFWIPDSLLTFPAFLFFLIHFSPVAEMHHV
jgi:hypothetical protein